MATGKQLFKIYGNQKELVASANQSLTASTLWLGIDEPGVSLHNTFILF
jgi:hypothetical protein